MTRLIVQNHNICGEGVCGHWPGWVLRVASEYCIMDFVVRSQWVLGVGTYDFINSGR